jgi:acyl-CoA synthetase (AMP-forming)/AMP-acid ligase II
VSSIPLSEAALQDCRSVVDSNCAEATSEGMPEEQSPRLLPDVLRVAAKACGNQVKVVSGTERLSYAEIDLYSDRLAGRLMAHDIRPGDRVMIGLPNSAEFIIACFAVWKVRAVVVALDPCTVAANLRGILQKIEPAALIAECGFAEKVLETPASLRFFRAFFLKNNCGSPLATGHIAVEPMQSATVSEAGLARLPAGAQPNELATITFTSGSTNVPKGVMHTHESTLACASFTRSYLNLSQHEVVMLPLPLHHVLAFRRFLTCFLAQCELVLVPGIFIMKQFSETHPTGLVLVPSACNILIDSFAPFLRKAGACLRYVEIGSEPMSMERVQALQATLPNTRIHLTYGLTEGRVGYLTAGPNGTFDRLDRSNHGLEIEVVDGNGHPVNEEETGEILISGAGLFLGYWGDSIATQNALKLHGFRTGDLGMMDENGGIRLIGRLDDIIKVGGHKIHPREIEAVLLLHPGVAEAVVVGQRDPGASLGSVLQAFVVRKKGFIVSDSELLAHCQEHLELYKVPATVCFRESFPKTALGKIQRHLVV